MDLQKIESFLALAQSLNFTRAAESLYKTQSVLSRNILALEEELGIKLFVRNKRNVALTPAGEHLAVGFKSILEYYDIVTAQAAAIDTGYEGTLNICSVAGQTISQTFAPVLQDFLKSYSNIFVNISAKNVAEIRYMLQHQQIDFAYGREIDFVDLQGIEYAPIFGISVCYAAAKSYPASSLFHRMKDDAELDTYPFVWTHELNSRIVDRLLAERQKRMGNANVLYAPDLNTMILWVELGYGFSLLNECSYFAQNPEACFYPAEHLCGKSTEGLIWRKDTVNPCVKTLVEFANSYKCSFHIH